MELRHTQTGDAFEHYDGWDERREFIDVIDSQGELRMFRREVLEPIPVQEEWEAVREHADIALTHLGQLNVWLRRGAWKSYPDKNIRFHVVDGVTVLQRRKT